MIILKYGERDYGTKFNNIQEMDKFQELGNLPRLNLKEEENLNRPLSREEVDTTIKTQP